MPAIKKSDGEITEKSYGECRWYFYSYKLNEIIEATETIHKIIQSDEHTLRVVKKEMSTLRKDLKIIELKAIQKHLRNMQALAGEKATLMCWMEIN